MTPSQLLATCLGVGAFMAIAPWVAAWVARTRAARLYAEAVERWLDANGDPPALAYGGTAAVLRGSISPGVLLGLGLLVLALLPTAISPRIGELYASRAWGLVLTDAVSCLAGGVLVVARSRGWRVLPHAELRTRAALECILAEQEEARRTGVATRRERARRPSAGITLEEMRAMTGQEFEQLCADYFARRGLTVDLTPSSGDGGVDLVLTGDGRCVLVQCKQTRKPVGEPVVRDLYGAVHHAGADAGIVCSTGGFTSAAQEWAAGKPIELLDGARLERGLRSSR